MKSKHMVSFAATILVAGAVVAIFQWGFRKSETSGVAQIQESSAHPEQEGDSLSGDNRLVHLSDDQLKRFGIKTGVAEPGRLLVEVTLPGELVLNADLIAHVVPRISGVVQEVRKNLGDMVRQGEVMAVVESRELADITAALFAARERVILAQSNFTREEKVWLKKISAEQDYIEAKNKLAEANIELRTAEQKLRAVGFSDDYIAKLPTPPDKSTILYEITAPFNATVIEKHISLGEVLSNEAAVFIVADLSSVWVNLDVQQKDLTLIRVGQKAIIEVPNANIRGTGQINFIEPIATATNRTIHARIVLPNRDGRFRPGLFVQGRILVEGLEVPLLVPNEALILMDGKMCVFVKEGKGFRLRPVTIGRRNEKHSEITSGLSVGELYVATEPFTLKSELGKPEAED